MQGQYEYSIDGNLQTAKATVSSTSNNSATAANHLIAKSKINPMSGGIPISTILP